MLRFALDQNFPAPVLEAMKGCLIEAELVSVREIDARLATMDDWELLLALHHCEPRCDGLVTTDSSMTSLPRELAVLMQTKLTLIVAQIWTLRAVTRQHEDPWMHIEKLAARKKKTAKVLYEGERLTDRELATNPLQTRPA